MNDSTKLIADPKDSRRLNLSVDFAILDDDTLREFRERCILEADKVAGQIDLAKSRVWTHGEFADAGWMARATAARRHLCRAKNRAEEELGRRKKAANIAREQDFGKAFLAVARRDLEQADFDAMLTEAIAITRGQAPWPGAAP